MPCMPKAQVKVTSLATDASHDRDDANAGIYLVVNLAPGEYLVQAEAPGSSASSRPSASSSARARASTCRWRSGRSARR